MVYGVKQLSDYEYHREPAGVIYCGDCMEILPLLEPNSVDLVLTDPPYGLNYLSNHYKGINPHNRIINDDKFFLPFRRVWNVIKDTGALFFFYSWKVEPIQMPMDIKIRNKIIWVKNNWTAGDLKGDYGNQYENIAFCPKDNFQIQGKRLSNVWFCDRISADKLKHPTEKPIGIITPAIISGSQVGQIILDPFLGSGTTAVAAKQLGRKFIGIEIEEKYCERAKQKLAQEELF
jgi:site-specific DNA-methyltransferase (adenine-specific)